jgi:hypothetical protein
VLRQATFFGGPANKIFDQMRADGFGDPSIFGAGKIFGIATRGTYTDFPAKSNRGVKFWVRYERDLKNNRGVELSFGMINRSTVVGYDSSTRISLAYDNILYGFKAHYLFFTARRNAAIGVGPAVVYYRVQPPKHGLGFNYETNTFLLPGLSLTGLWKFVNREHWFMSIRTDGSCTTPAKISGYTFTREGKTAEFKGTKAGSFVGSVTVGGGIKF